MTTRTRPQPIATTLLRIVVVFRVVGAAWLVGLSILVLVTEEADNSALIISVIAVAVTWTGLTVLLAYGKSEVLGRTAFLIPDLVLAIGIAMTPGLLGTDIFFVGGYPISAAFLVATTRGTAATVAPALAVAAASATGVGSASARAAEVLAINFLSPLVLAWAFGVIKRQDRERREAEEALAGERTKLARAEERAEMAARIHDSVLQTLALIQRSATDHAEVRRIARSQEREIRSWLNGGVVIGDDNTLNEAINTAAQEVEKEYDVSIAVSTVGDAPMGERINAMVLAAREAMTNAARFAGVDNVYVLAESDPGRSRVVVRDKGRGFEPASIESDRRGVSESIIGRMRRMGGNATVRSTTGEGTEVTLELDHE